MVQRIWNLLCSLKLAIILASLATLVVMGGSLLIPYNVGIYGSLDRMIMGEWLATVGAENPGHSWWIRVTGVLMLLFGINTLCCFIDWAVRIRSRWRKSGEYLIHLGFVLILGAYFWGSVDGFRISGFQVGVGETRAVPEMPGYYLSLDRFEPLLGEGGRPLDMINQVSLFKGDQQVAEGTVKINTPLLHEGLVVIPQSFGRTPEGFRFSLPGGRKVDLERGSRIALGGRQLEVVEFFPAARQRGRQVLPGGDRLTDPAFHVRLSSGGQTLWQGWYFLRRGVPADLQREGVLLRPLEPLYSTYSVLTITRDPGASVALAGAVSMTAGVALALFSFYYKRARRDRPEVA